MNFVILLFQVEFVINWENWKLPIKQSRWPNFIFFNQMSQIHIIFNCWTPATYPSKVIPCSKRQYGHTDTLSLKSKKAMLIYISCLVMLPIVDNHDLYYEWIYNDNIDCYENWEVIEIQNSWFINLDETKIDWNYNMEIL